MRDKGVCALCGLDTEPLYKQAARLCNPGRWGYVASESTPTSLLIKPAPRLTAESKARNFASDTY